MRTETTVLIDAMRILANEIESEDGVANAAIAEAADRLEELNAELEQALKAKDAAEQERYQLEVDMAALKPYRDNHHDLIRHMAAHDAAVIERAREYVTSRVEESDFAADYDWALLEYGQKLRQQAKEVQS